MHQVAIPTANPLPRMRSRRALALWGLLLCASLTTSWAQQESQFDPQTSFKIDLPEDTPVTLLGLDLGNSRVLTRGGALELDLKTGLTLRNSSSRRIRGIALSVVAQDGVPGGKGSVVVPALDVAPNENFPVRVDLRMVRPPAQGGGPLVRVRIDGVLFDDLSFYGDNKLNSRRSLTVWELEAQRDRKHFQSVLAAEGPKGLEREVLAAIARLKDRPRLDVTLARTGNLPRGRTALLANSMATNIDPAHEVQFAFLTLPEAPVELVAGSATIAGDEARAPRFTIRNRSSKPVKYMEVGWTVRDAGGLEYFAASVPADLALNPGAQTTVPGQAALRIRPAGPAAAALPPLQIAGVSGFPHSVEFTDGKIWIPSRENLKDPRLARLLPPSPEEQRLLSVYQRKGLTGLLQDLKK